MAPAIITSENPPIEVLMPFGARLDQMLVVDGDSVEKEEVLAY